MTEPDYFGLSDSDEIAKARGPALVVGPPMRNHELLAHEWMHRHSRAPEVHGASEIIFVEEDGELGAEQRTKWQALMNFPRPPTAEECLQFKLHRQALLTRAYWESMRAAVAKDDAESADAQRARVSRASEPRNLGKMRRR
jgi:hypothetical protein